MYKNSNDLYLDLINDYVILSPYSDKFILMNDGCVYRWDSCFKFKPNYPFCKSGKWIGKWVNTTINIRDFAEMCWLNCKRGPKYNNQKNTKLQFVKGV